jgi:hypothetical protein
MAHARHIEMLFIIARDGYQSRRHRRQDRRARRRLARRAEKAAVGLPLHRTITPPSAETTAMLRMTRERVLAPSLSAAEKPLRRMAAEQRIRSPCRWLDGGWRMTAPSDFSPGQRTASKRGAVLVCMGPPRAPRRYAMEDAKF